MKSLVIAATHSGEGKTTVTLGLVAALLARGLKVGAFKVGPDFIDASHLAASSRAGCLNLDGWMMSREVNRQRFHTSAESCDVAVVEGMMGLFDGRGGESEVGSTAEMAKWLGLPVVLVVDAAGAARSVAAAVLGFRTFDLTLNVAGVIFNRVGGPGHAAYLRQAMSGAAGCAVLGMAEVDEYIRIPERHLGLHMPEVSPAANEFAKWAERHLDIDGLLQAAKTVDASAAPTRAAPQKPVRRRMGVARDEAFCFYYPDNLAMLKATGVELVEFSPLRDSALPQRLDGIYLGGGYPEVYGGALAANTSMRTAVRAFAVAGGFIYAECGGMMYLGQEIAEAKGACHVMAGVLPCAIAMQARPQAVGYREVQPVGLGASAEMRVRGHEFHYSKMIRRESPGAPAHLMTVSGSEAVPEGFSMANVCASYIHLHFASNPAVVELLVERMGGRN